MDGGPDRPGSSAWRGNQRRRGVRTPRRGRRRVARGKAEGAPRAWSVLQASRQALVAEAPSPGGNGGRSQPRSSATWPLLKSPWAARTGQQRKARSLRGRVDLTEALEVPGGWASGSAGRYAGIRPGMAVLAGDGAFSRCRPQDARSAAHCRRRNRPLANDLRSGHLVPSS